MQQNSTSTRHTTLDPVQTSRAPVTPVTVPDESLSLTSGEKRLTIAKSSESQGKSGRKKSRVQNQNLKQVAERMTQ